MWKTILTVLWPALAWFASRAVAEAAFEDLLRFRAAASTLAPAILALVTLIASRAGTIGSWGMVACLFGSAISGLIGICWEYGRWAHILHEPHVTHLYILRHLDWLLVLASVVALLVPFVAVASRFKGFSIPWPSTSSRNAFGSAAFMPVREAAKRFSKGDLVIGEAYDPKYMRPTPGRHHSCGWRGTSIF